MGKWDRKVIQELLQEGDVDKVAEYASKRAYAKIIVDLLKENPVATPEDLAKVAYPVLSMRSPKWDWLIKFIYDYVRPSTLTNEELRRRFYTALGKIIEVNKDYDLYEYLYDGGNLYVTTTALLRGIKPYGDFSNELSKRKRKRNSM